ncbi:MAG: glycosyltransferase family 39 protein [Chloroflexi bacterium]|nr:glycosyltransferase family 39 protein [Chloroflexota bacterium]
MTDLRRRPWWEWLGVAALAALALGFGLYATRNGSDIMPDAVAYMNLADNFRAGRGFVLDVNTPDSTDDARVVFTVAPAYTVAIAILGWLGLGAEQAARWVSVLSFGAVIVPTYWLGRRAGGWLAGGLAALFTSVFSTLTWLATQYRADALFMFWFVLATAACVEAALAQERRRHIWWLSLMAFSTAFAILARYAGLMLVGGGLLGLVLFDRPARRWRSVVWFASLVGVMVGPWLITSWLTTGYLTGRPHFFPGVVTGPENLVVALQTFKPFVPEPRLGLREGNALGIAAGLALLMAVVWTGIGLLRRREWLFDRWRERRWMAPVATVLLFAAIYFAPFVHWGYTLMISYYDWPRYLSPAFPLLFVVAAWLLGDALRAASAQGSDRWRTLAGGVIVAGVCWSYLLPTLGYAAGGADYQGYASPPWRRSTSLPQLAELLTPEDVVFSEQPYAILYWLRRPAKALQTFPDLERVVQSTARTSYLVIFKGALSSADPLNPVIGIEEVKRYGVSHPNLRSVMSTDEMDVYRIALLAP